MTNIETCPDIKNIKNIGEIENMDFETAKNLASEIINIKDHTCCFINFSKPFGYSAIVFANNKQIYYANEYQLHWESIKTIEKLKERFIKNHNEKLFTETELKSPVKSYDEYKRKSYYIRNYDILKYDHMSMFYISKSGDANNQDDYKKRLKAYPFVNNISFCYMKEQDKNVIEYQTEICKFLNSECEKLKNDNKAFRKMIAYELANHEACVTGDYSDALGSLNLKFKELDSTKQKIVLSELKKQISRYC